MPRGLSAKSQHQVSCEARAQNSQPGTEGGDDAKPQKHTLWSLTDRTHQKNAHKQENKYMKVAPHHWSSSHWSVHQSGSIN